MVQILQWIQMETNYVTTLMTMMMEMVSSILMSNNVVRIGRMRMKFQSMPMVVESAMDWRPILMAMDGLME